MVDSKLSYNLTEQGDILNAYSRALRREAHILTQHPDLTWQQLYNRLQWEGDAVKQILTAELADHCRPGAAPWIHNKFRLRESEAFISLFKGHSEYVHSCAFSPDGKTLATGSYDHTVRLWNLRNGEERAVLKGHSERVYSCAFSPDGRILASVSGDQTVRLWDADSGKELAILTGHTSDVSSCAFSPDGHTLATTSSDNTIRLWDVRTKKEQVVFKGHSEWAYSCAFSPDGRTLASASWDNTVRLWNVDTRKEQATLNGHKQRTYTCAFSPDGTILASGSKDKTIRLWDARSGEERMVLQGHTADVTSCAFSPDGKTLASASWDKTIRLWNIQTGKEFRVLTGHTNYVYSCIFSPDGHSLASASWDKTVRQWNTHIEEDEAIPIGHTDYIHSLAFSPNGNTLASASEDKTVLLWDTHSGNNQLILGNQANSVTSCAFSPDGYILALASEDNTIRLWENQIGMKPAPLEGHSSSVTSCAFSPDGHSLVSASSDSTLRLWDVHTGEEIAELMGHTNSVHSCTFSPDGSFVASTSEDGTVRLWDVELCEERMILKGHVDSVYSCVFSPDGCILASTGWDNTVRLWNIRTGKEHITLEGHTACVTCCSFSPDGNILATASFDHSIKLWDVQSGEHIRTYQCSGMVGACAFGPLDKILAAGDMGGTVYLLELVGFEAGPIILTAAEGKQGLVVRCPACRQKISVTREQLGSEIICPAAACGQRLKLNQFVVTQLDNVLPFAGRSENAQEASPATISSIQADKAPEKSIEKRHIGVISLTDNGQVVIGYDDGCFGILNLGNDLPEMIMEDNYAPITTIANSLDGSLSASGSRDGMLQIWDLEMKELLDSFIFPHEISALAIGSDNRVLVGLENGTLIVWDGMGGQFAFDGHEGRVSAIAIFPNGQIVSSGKDLKIRCWDPNTHEMLKSFTGIKSPITAMCTAGIGNQVVAGCEDKLLFIWDFDISKAKATYRGKSQVLAASGNQSSILMGNKESKASVFSLETGTILYNHDYDTQIEGGTLSPDGKKGAVFDNQNVIYRFEIEH